MNRKLFIVSIIGITFVSGCINTIIENRDISGKKRISGESPYINIELLDSIDISPDYVLSKNYSLESIIKDRYSWAYSKNGLKGSIKENSTFITRVHFTYPLKRGESYITGTRINVKYYPDMIGIIKPISDEYNHVDVFYRKGHEGGILKVDEYRYGAYGELKRGEEQEIIFIGTTKEIKNIREGITPIYIGLSIYGDEIVNDTLLVRIVE